MLISVIDGPIFGDFDWSLAMHLPYPSKLFAQINFTVVGDWRSKIRGGNHS
jgi:hypothetical protein